VVDVSIPEVEVPVWVVDNTACNDAAVETCVRAVVVGVDDTVWVAVVTVLVVELAEVTLVPVAVVLVLVAVVLVAVNVVEVTVQQLSRSHRASIGPHSILHGK
jgi:hypothetical protein